MRRVLAAAAGMILLAVTVGSAQEGRIQVHVKESTRAADGVDPRAQIEVQKNLVVELGRKRKIIEVVDQPSGADLVLELKPVDLVDQFFYVAVLVMKVGDEDPIEMGKTHTDPMIVGVMLGDDVEQWVRDNELRMLAKRHP
jgi:hypothetical protein